MGDGRQHSRGAGIGVSKAESGSKPSFFSDKKDCSINLELTNLENMYTFARFDDIMRYFWSNRVEGTPPDKWKIE